MVSPLFPDVRAIPGVGAGAHKPLNTAPEFLRPLFSVFLRLWQADTLTHTHTGTPRWQSLTLAHNQDREFLFLEEETKQQQATFKYTTHTDTQARTQAHGCSAMYSYFAQVCTWSFRQSYFKSPHTDELSFLLTLLLDFAISSLFFLFFAKKSRSRTHTHRHAGTRHREPFTESYGRSGALNRRILRSSDKLTFSVSRCPSGEAFLNDSWTLNKEMLILWRTVFWQTSER